MTRAFKQSKRILFDDSSKIILYVDYNGDGKADILIPNVINSDVWNKFTSTGTNFNWQSQTYNFLNYQPASNLIGKHYISTDFNNDGKSDIIKLSFEVQATNPNSGWTILQSYANHNGIFSQGFLEVLVV